MMHRKRRSKATFQWMKYVMAMAIFIIIIVGLTIYLLPFVAYYEVETAIMAKDVGKFASHVDFTEMRRNLKMQKGQRVIKTLSRSKEKEMSLVDVSISWSALTSDQQIDQAISTEGFYITLSGAGADRKQPDPIRPSSEVDSLQMIKKLIAESSFKYQSFSKFVVSAKDEKGRYVGYCTFVFIREGLQWRLANVVLPVI